MCPQKASVAAGLLLVIIGGPCIYIQLALCELWQCCCRHNRMRVRLSHWSYSVLQTPLVRERSIKLHTQVVRTLHTVGELREVILWAQA